MCGIKQTLGQSQSYLCQFVCFNLFGCETSIQNSFVQHTNEHSRKYSYYVFRRLFILGKIQECYLM